MVNVSFNPSARTALAEISQLNRQISRSSVAIATGRRVNTSADDPQGFAQIQRLTSSLRGYETSWLNVSAGRETVGVAREGADQIVSVLQAMKTTITAANNVGADYTALTAELDAHRLQYQGLLNTAQMSGVSLLKGGASFDVTSGVYIDENGAVQRSVLSTSSQDLRISDTFGTGPTVTNANATGAGSAVANGDTVTLSFLTYAASDGDSFRVTIDGEVFEYVADSTDTDDDVVEGLRQLIQDGVSARNLGVTVGGVTNNTITITNNSGSAMQIEYADAQGGTSSGALRGVRDLSVASSTNAAAALTEIDALIEAATDAASRLGSSEGRFDTQESFLNNLIFSAENSISRIGDIDVAEESVRLTNLQSQYDLAISALAANTESQNSILRLFF